MSKHTPGPWHHVSESRQIADTGDFYSWVAVRNSEGHDLFITDREDERLDPDAALIAAAPELLAALKRALPFLKRYTYERRGTGPSGHLIEVAFMDAYEAVRKAEGGEK